VTCTVTNNDIAPTLTVIKHVVNDNGGTALASAFALDSGGANDSPDDFPGAESPGTVVTLNANAAYSVSESGPAGYATSYSANCGEGGWRKVVSNNDCASSNWLQSFQGLSSICLRRKWKDKLSRRSGESRACYDSISSHFHCLPVPARQVESRICGKLREYPTFQQV
jgi:hypothetical protein